MYEVEEQEAMPGVRLTHGAMSSKCQSNSAMLKRPVREKSALGLVHHNPPAEYDEHMQG